MKRWTQEDAIDMCRRIEAIAPDVGAHIGLTGGLLYKDGARKDLDIVVYRIRQLRRSNARDFSSCSKTLESSLIVTSVSS